MLLRRYSSFLHISLVLTWNMILFEPKYHFKKAIFIGTIFLWNVFLFWVIWFTYSFDKMSTLDTIVKDYDKNIVLRNCQRQAFEYLHQKLSHDRLLHDHVFWDYFWDVYRDREPARTDNSVWEIENGRGILEEKCSHNSRFHLPTKVSYPALVEWWYFLSGVPLQCIKKS